MQYIKRMLFLVVLIGLSVLATSIQPAENTDFSIEVVLFCIINIFIVIAFIGVYATSKTIIRSTGVIILEFIILVILILFSFIEQFDLIFNLFLNTKFNMNIVLYIQFILGIWLISFINILRNKKARRNKMYSTRYMK